MTSLEESISKGRNTLSADRLDMSFGEIMNMYSADELVIDPDFQRLFRWDIAQRTRFIESLLLGIPIPSIFVAEDKNGRWEIVDGLQRISTILSFFGLLKNSKENKWVLCDGEIVEGLDSLNIDNIPTKFLLNIKRSACRIEVIKWDSKYDMRYELFNRLNTGGSPLTDQEIRNCIFRGVSPDLTIEIKELAALPQFIELIKPSERQSSQLYLDELVLRFYSLFGNHEIKKNISEHMTDFMRDASNNPQLSTGKKEIFLRTIAILSQLDKNLFKGVNNQLSSSLYDGVMVGISSYIEHYEKLKPNEVMAKINELKEDEEFAKATGVAASYKHRVKTRVERALIIFRP